MKISMVAAASLCVGALGLAACAASNGGGSGTSAAATPAKKTNVVYTVADAETAAKIPSGYTLIRKQGVEYYCRSELATGSHTSKKETCLTKEQLKNEGIGANNTTDYAAGR